MQYVHPTCDREYNRLLFVCHDGRILRIRQRGVKPQSLDSVTVTAKECSLGRLVVFSPDDWWWERKQLFPCRLFLRLFLRLFRRTLFHAPFPLHQPDRQVPRPRPRLLLLDAGCWVRTENDGSVRIRLLPQHKCLSFFFDNFASHGLRSCGAYAGSRRS